MLKPNRVVAGMKCAQQVAEVIQRYLLRHVPVAVPGIVFLSGGPTDYLNAMNALGPLHWRFSFSDGQALQAPVPGA